jgi:hypothetical protein
MGGALNGHYGEEANSKICKVFKITDLRLRFRWIHLTLAYLRHGAVLELITGCKPKGQA